MPLTPSGLYYSEDIAFINSNLLNEAARHFKKHGVYTFAPEGSREHKEFWDLEEKRRRAVLILLRQLPPQMRVMMGLRYEGYSDKEIANKKGVSYETVRANICRGIKKARRFLNTSQAA